MRQIRPAVCLPVLAALCMMAAGGCAAVQGHAAARPAAPADVVIHLTSGGEDLQGATMGLLLAAQAAEQGRSVVVYLDVRSPQLATWSYGKGPKYRDFPPVSQLLHNLVNQGVTVLACRDCLPALGVAEVNLARGVQAVSAQQLLSRVGPKTAVFSY